MKSENSISFKKRETDNRNQKEEIEQFYESFGALKL